jgi:catechol 2,3-dioxygenase-like lactoylglutathione lyase family enzyme
MGVQQYQRSSQDVGNIIEFSHIRMAVPDLTMATVFYSNGLGFTRDPYVDLGPEMMWVNAGRQQFHLPVGDPQVVRGIIELVVPSLSGLLTRLRAVAECLASTQFDVRRGNGFVEVKCPWGNRFRCVNPSVLRPMQMGIRSVDLPVPERSLAGIERFYRDVCGAKTALAPGGCSVVVGPDQVLQFSATDGDLASFDGHRVAVYVANFSRLHRWLNERKLVFEETSEFQYCFNWIMDPSGDELLFEIGHEIRSLYHPLHQRPLINRNADQTLAQYLPGADPFQPGTATHRGSMIDVDILGTIG